MGDMGDLLVMGNDEIIWGWIHRKKDVTCLLLSTPHISFWFNILYLLFSDTILLVILFVYSYYTISLVLVTLVFYILGILDVWHKSCYLLL